MPKHVTVWTHKQTGATVSVVQRAKALYLRHTRERLPVFTPLRHTDVMRAKEQARELSRELANARASNSGAPGATSRLTVSELFARYTRNVSALKKGDQPREDERRRILWLAYLGADKRASSVTPADVQRFIGERRLGRIVVDGLKLKTKVKPRTVDADVVWLQSVYNWADRAKLVTSKPLLGAQRPDVAAQLRPMADATRVAKLLKVAPKVHPRFALLLTAVRTLGWRISAVTKIDAADIRRTRTTLAPYGEIRKNWETDKEGVSAWLAMPKALRVAIDAAKLPKAGPVFPSSKDAELPMSRYYARELLERAEAFAKLPAIEGGDWHPYRRLWATERKGLPMTDVADAGGWADQRTVQKYQQKDPATSARVMLFTPTTRKAATKPHGPAHGHSVGRRTASKD